jgi:D-alanine-D-alanine ligase
VEAVGTTLESAGHETVSVRVDAEFADNLMAARVDLVFNTYFGPARRQDQAYVASAMEYVGVPFSGGDATCHFIGLSKSLTKRLLLSESLPTPRFSVGSGASETIQAVESQRLEFPLIVKAQSEGEGIGLDERSVVRTPEALREAFQRVTDEFHSPPVIEEFMPGREFTVGVIDGTPSRILSPLEIMVSATQVFSFAAKSEETIDEKCPAKLSGQEAAHLGELALRAGRAVGARDYWRVDFRQNAQGAPMVLEVNTLPGLQPGYSDMTKMFEPSGLSYFEVIMMILGSASRRVAHG